MMGKIDILPIAIAGGFYTVTPPDACELTKIVNPKMVMPMHFWWEKAVQEFVPGMPKVKTFKTPVLKFAKSELSVSTEVVVLPQGQGLNDFCLEDRGESELTSVGSEVTGGRGPQADPRRVQEGLCTHGAPNSEYKGWKYYPSRLCFRLFMVSQDFFWRR